MHARPDIFISAATSDLHTCRQLVRDALLTLGCVPVVQDHFAPEARTVREMLRTRIASCDAVIHLAGLCYGHEPHEQDPNTPRRSYTQMEYDIARELKKPLYIFICAEDYPYDAHEPEDEERRALQAAHRVDLQNQDYIFVPIHSTAELEKSVRELQTRIELLGDDLSKTRSWLTRGLAATFIVLLLIGGVLLLLHRRAGDIQQQTALLQQQNQVQQQQLAAMQAQLAQQTQLIALVSEKIDRNAPPVAAAPGKSDPVAAARAATARQLGISVEELEKQLAAEGTNVRALLVRIDERSASAETQAAEWKKLKRAALTKLGDGEYDAGRYAASIDPYRQALALVDEQKDPAAWCGAAANLERALWKQGQYAEAAPLARQLVDKRSALLGAEHPDTLQSIHDLANLLFYMGDYAGAEPVFRRALEARERVLGKEHPDTLRTVNNLASMLYDKGDLAGAEPLYRRNLEVQERTLGREHPDTLRSVSNLANVLMGKGDYAAAEPLYRRALEAQERALGKEHPDTLLIVNSLAGLLYSKGDLAGAEILFRRALEANERTLGPDHPNTLACDNNLALLLKAKHDYAGAESLYRRALEAQERTLGKEHPDTLASLSNLAELLDAKGDLTAAEPLYLSALAHMERALPPEHPYRLDLDCALSLLRQKQGRLPEALMFAEHAVAGARKTMPETSPDRRQYEQNLTDLQTRMAAGKTNGP